MTESPTPPQPDPASRRLWRGRVFVGMSLDGYIARPNSDLDYLLDPPPGIEHEAITTDRRALEWEAFISDVDHLVMGRGTYEKVLTFDHWPYADLTVIVLSTTLSDSADERITVIRSVEAASDLLSQREARNVYVDGGKVVQAFLADDLIDEITVAIAPVLIGVGIPLFGSLPDDIRLRLRAAHASAAGMTHATYDVVRPA
jgi:dihydrofolate reductase